jgi:hypothetical protein
MIADVRAGRTLPRRCPPIECHIQHREAAGWPEPLDSRNDARVHNANSMTYLEASDRTTAEFGDRVAPVALQPVRRSR